MALDLLIQQVDPKACHLINHPRRLWVFGGVCGESSEPIKSLRDAFWRKTINPPFPKVPDWISELSRPEEFDDWWAFSGYEDLLSFERDACYLARATILFAESSGSIAELGALAIDDYILPKLFVVIQNKYLEDERRRSFLNLGPLKRVESRGYRCVISSHEGVSLLEDDFDTIIESIESWLPHPHQTSTIQPKNPTHRLLLIADIIDLLIISKKNEVMRAISHFGIEISDSELSRSIKLLDFFHLIKIQTRGNEPFLMHRNDSQAPWINYTAIKGKSFDRSRFKTKCQELILDDKRKKSILERKE